MLKADMIQVRDYSTRFMAQNSNACCVYWSLRGVRPAFEFADIGSMPPRRDGGYQDFDFRKG